MSSRAELAGMCERCFIDEPSFAVRPLAFRKCPFVKRARQRGQSFSNQVKEKPREKKPANALDERNRPGQKTPLEQRDRSQFAQARRADDPVVVFRDAFAAKELAAFRAPGHSFALAMVE